MLVEGMHDIQSEQKQKARQKYLLWSFVLFVLISGLVLYYFSAIKKEFILLEKVQPVWLGIAVSAQIATYGCTATIYYFLLKAYQLKEVPGLRKLFSASLISLFFNQTMPSAGISGNIFFLNFLLRYGAGVSSIVSLIITELLIFYVAMLLVIIFLLLFCMSFTGVPGVFKGTLAGGALIYLLFGLAIILAGKKNFVYRFLKRIAKVKFLRSLTANINKGFTQQEIMSQEMKLFIFVKEHKKATLYSFVFQLMLIASDAFTVYALFSGLGVSISLIAVLLGFICAKIISILPFLPGALILYESSMTFFFVSLSVPLHIAVIVTLVYRLLSFWLPMPVGFFLYRRWLAKKVP